MTNLVQLLEKSPTLRQFYYDEHVKELQKTIEDLRRTIRSQNNRESMMEDAYAEKEDEIEKLQKRIEKLCVSDDDNPNETIRKLPKVDFNKYKHEQDYEGETMYEALQEHDVYYNRREKCYDRGDYCGIPECRSAYAHDCDTCHAQVCDNHYTKDYLYDEVYPDRNLRVLQCDYCLQNKHPVRRCACIVCGELYNPHDENQEFAKLSNPGRELTYHTDCSDHDYHDWTCVEHRSYSDVESAIKEKNWECSLCNDIQEA